MVAKGYAADGDPLQTVGTIFDVKKYALHDGPGIRTTVFLKGCSLNCLWCHNPESHVLRPEHLFRANRCDQSGFCITECPNQALSMVEGVPTRNQDVCEMCGHCVIACPNGAWEIAGERKTVEQIVSEIEKDTIFYDQSSGGVTFSGGEPLMQPKFLLHALTECKRLEIHTAVDTSCYTPREELAKIAEFTDMFLCDVKHMDPTKHGQYTGIDLDQIHDNIRWLAEQGKTIILRMPLVPDYNNDDVNLHATGQFATSLATVERLDLLPYHNGDQIKKKRLERQIEEYGMRPPTDDEMAGAEAILSSYGIEVKIGG